MAAIACLNPVSLSNTNHVPAASAPVEMSFLLDSGAGRNLMSKKDMPEGWNDRVIEPAENLVFRTGGGERKASESISLQGNISGNNDFFVLKECPPVLSLGTLRLSSIEEVLFGCLIKFRTLLKQIGFKT